MRKNNGALHSALSSCFGPPPVKKFRYVNSISIFRETLGALVFLEPQTLLSKGSFLVKGPFCQYFVNFWNGIV